MKTNKKIKRIRKCHDTCLGWKLATYQINKRKRDYLFWDICGLHPEGVVHLKEVASRDVNEYFSFSSSDAILFNIFLDQINISNIFPRNWNFFYQESQICDSPGIIVDKRHFRFFLTTGNWFDGSLGLFRFEFTFMAIILLLMGVGFLSIHILLFLWSICLSFFK